MASMCKMSKGFKYFLTFWAFIENLMFSGLRAGWPALVYILKQEQIYSHLCKESTVNSHNVTANATQSMPSLDNSSNFQANNQSEYAFVVTNTVSLVRNNTLAKCDEQDAVFNQCFTVATALMALSALLYGQLNYKYGIRAPRVLSVFLFVAGAVSIAFINKDVPWLVFPGLILVSSGGMALYVTNIQISYLYSRVSAGIVGLLCGALEASSFVQTVIKMAYESGVSLRVSYLVLGGLYLTTLFSTFLLLPKRFISVPVSRTLGNKDDNCELLVQSRSTEDPIVEMKSENGSYDVIVPEKLIESYKTKSRTHNQLKEEINGQLINIDLMQADEDKSTRTLCKEQSGKLKGVNKKSVIKCVCTRTFLLYLFWSCVVNLVLAMCLGTFNPWLEFVTNTNIQEVSQFTDVLLYSMLASPVLSMLIGLSMDFLNRGDNSDQSAVARRTLHTSCMSLGATSALAVVVCAFFIVSDPGIIVLTSVTLVIFRTALYGCGTAFLRIMYPTEYFGLLCGIMSLLAGCFGFLQYPLFVWVQLRVDAWAEVFGLLAVLALASMVQPIYLAWKGRQCYKNKSADIK